MRFKKPTNKKLVKKVMVVSRLDIDNVQLLNNDTLNVTHNFHVDSRSAGLHGAYDIGISFGAYQHKNADHIDVNTNLFLGYEISIKPIFVYSPNNDKMLIEYGEMTVAQLEFNKGARSFSK
jgi:hypothetical protein